MVAEAYRTFRRRPAPPFPLDVCLPCCVSEEVERQLRQWPLARLTPHHFYEYNTSAKSLLQSAREVGYLLPRWLELLAEGARIHHSIELSLDRLGRCPRGSWSEDEQALLDRFALAFFDCVLRGGPLGQAPGRWQDDPLSVLLMFDIGGLAIEPLLARWLSCEDPVSTAQFVVATYWDFWDQGEYGNAFASDRPAFKETIREWLQDPDHRQRFVAKLLAPGFQALVEVHLPIGRTTFSAMVDGVFDHLAR